MSRALRRRLLLRVYLYGVLMLALAGGAVVAIGTYVLAPAVELPVRPSTTWIALHLAAIADQPEQLAKEIADIEQRGHIELALFRADGSVVASSSRAALGAFSARELEQLERDRSHFADGLGAVVVTEPNGAGVRYVRLRYPTPELPLGLIVIRIAVALGVLAVLSVPLARSVTAPVERLAAVTRAFGAGDLSVRINSTRQDEIGDLGREFDQMAERLAALRRSEKELLANVSHELRTPLSRIRIALELVSEGDITRASGYLEDIEDDLAELETLLDDVMTAARLDLARGSAGDAVPVHKQRVSVAELIRAAEARFRRRFPERDLDCQIADGLPEIHADAPLLRRALDNLLDNAAKFSDSSASIALEASSSDAPDAELVIRVRDHGAGIAAEDLNRVFEPFYRRDASRTRETGGVGLGLALARRIVHAHGGAVDVESTSAQGTCFRIVVPAASA